MVAGQQQHLAAGHLRADRSQHRLGRGQRTPGLTGDQLERVPQQHQAVDLLQHVEQGGERGRTTQHIAVAPDAQMQVRDDQRAQAPGP